MPKLTPDEAFAEAERRIARARREKVRVFDLSNLDCAELPESIGRLIQLTELHLHDNQLKTLPFEVGLLSNLNELHVYGNQLSELPHTVGCLSNLVELRISEKDLSALPDTIGRLSNLSELHASENQLRALPHTIGNLTNLKTLSVFQNRLTSLPEEIGRLINLAQLYAQENLLTSLPDQIGQLDKLATLYLGDNRLTTLPGSFARLHHLAELHLYRNRVATFPQALTQLRNLSKLYISENQLTELPQSLGQLNTLTRLELAQNKLPSLPEAIGELSHLLTLDISRNCLVSLPESLRRLSSLSELYLHGNPLLGLPPEILGPYWQEVRPQTPQTPPAAILDYYFEAQRDGRRLNEVKLILVGRGEVGKTSLVRRLIDNTFDPKEEQTPGIRITPWTHPLAGYGDVQLNVWDFGGQEIMHGTHQFFLTERSLYLVVLTGRAGKEREEAEYWLRFVQQFGNSAPTLVVLNKYKQFPFELERKSLREKFPFVVGFVETDCHGSADAKAPPTLNGFGIDTLTHAIDEQLAKWDALQYRFPAKWFAIKDALSGMPNDYITFADYREICDTHKEPNPKRQEHLAKYLNQLGIALNFKDDPRLRDTHVLKPNWLTNGVYAFLNDKPLAANKGVFTFGELSRVLPADKYPPDMHCFLLDLMRKFDLCFRLENGEDGAARGATVYAPEDRFLLPERLPVDQPDLGDRFAPEKCLGFEYRYPTWPEGLVPRFIVRTHVLSEGKERWRSGVVIEFDGCEALVKGDEIAGTVTLRITGPGEARRNALATARTYFEEIHRAMGITPDEFVAHPTKRGLYVAYQDLVAYEEAKQTEFTVIWEKKPLKITVAEMLNIADPPGTRVPAEAIEHAARAFVSYAHRDERHMERLKAHLKLAERQKLITVWYDRLLVPGEEWDPRILEELNKADIIVMLVSAHFFASEYIFDKELPRALERHTAKEAVAMSVVLSACEWDKTDVAKFELLPPKGKPVVKWSDRDEAWNAVASAVRAAAENLRAKRHRK